MQLIWVLVPTNDVLYNWIIMVLKKMQKNSYKKREHYWHRRALKNSLGGKIFKKYWYYCAEVLD